MNNILLYGHGGAYNHGAEAILVTTIDCIRNRVPKIRIGLSTHFKEQDIEFGIDTDEYFTRDEKYVTLENITSHVGLYDAEIYKSTIKAATSDTLALSVGGDNYCYPAWHRWRCIHENILKMGARDILWSCSVNPDMLSKEMVETLSTYELITARESLTYETLCNKGLKM